MDKALQQTPDNKEVQELKNLYKNVDVENMIDKFVVEYLTLKKNPNKSKQQEKQQADLQLKVAYMTALDNGTFLDMIPVKAEEQYGLLSLRQRLVKENDCKSAMELILVDQLAAAYWRLMKYELYANRLPAKEDDRWSFDQLKVNVLKEVRNNIEQAHRQINMSLTMLKDLKQPQLRVNVKTDNAYFAQNQQVVNEKPKDEPMVETIKPK